MMTKSQWLDRQRLVGEMYGKRFPAATLMLTYEFLLPADIEACFRVCLHWYSLHGEADWLFRWHYAREFGQTHIERPILLPFGHATPWRTRYGRRRLIDQAWRSGTADKCFVPLQGLTSQPDRMAFFATGLAASHGPVITLFDLSGKRTGTLRGHQASVTALACGEDLKGVSYVLSGSNDGSLRLWDTEASVAPGARLVLRRTDTFISPVIAMAFDAKAWMAVGVHANGRIHVWDLAGHGACVHEYNALLPRTFSTALVTEADSKQPPLVLTSHRAPAFASLLTSTGGVKSLFWSRPLCTWVKFLTAPDPIDQLRFEDERRQRRSTDLARQPGQPLRKLRWLLRGTLTSISVLDLDKTTAFQNPFSLETMNNNQELAARVTQVGDVQPGQLVNTLEGAGYLVASAHDDEKIVVVSDDMKLHVWHLSDVPRCLKTATVYETKGVQNARA